MESFIELRTKNLVLLIPGKTAQQILFSLSPEYIVGIVIAGNPGRPGGSIGKMNRKGINPRFDLSRPAKTQEENVLQTTICCLMRDGVDIDKWFCETFSDKWGMLNPSRTDHKTLQGLDFTQCLVKHDGTFRSFYYDFSYTIPYPLPFSRTHSAFLSFTYGPNVAYEGRSSTSSCTRTKVAYYRFDKHYDAFKESIRTAYRAVLLDQIKHGVEISILPQLSGGIYSGYKRTHKEIKKDYVEILNSVLGETHNGLEIGAYFKAVILCDLNNEL